jgi:phosphonoacetate hydrolase
MNAPTRQAQGTVTANGRPYRWMDKPLVIVCVDGSETDYITQAVLAGVAPFLEQMCKEGTSLLGECVVPSFTNPNNLSIVTGVPPAVHGICGNYFYDVENDEEVMMNDAKYLRCETLLAGFANAGAKVTVITAKDKLRTLLGKGMKAMCFSAEKVDQLTEETNGITGVLELVGKPLPKVYSQDLSEFVFAAGVKIMAKHRPDIMYLSTTDYVQHKHAPGTPAANDFYRMMSGYLAQLHAMDVTIALTADHGMNAKTDTAGAPQIVFLQDWFDAKLGKAKARVILPVTDPYVAHHGSLGSFATAYLPEGADHKALFAELTKLPGIELVLSRADAAARFELPPDRIGDVVVVSERLFVIGTSPSRHDLSGLDAPLRSHGGVSEQRVPLLFNRKLEGVAPERRLTHWTYHNPVAIHFGAGVVETLPALLAGRKATLVTFPEAEGFGLLPRLRTLLGASLTGVIDQTQPNPDVDGLDRLYREFWKTQAESEVIIAVGGGSALDTAKALMVGTASGEFDALVGLLSTGKAFKPHHVKKLIAVPTTSGTGSEVTGWATIWNRAAGKKYSLHLPETWPEAAVVDPELVLSLPAGPTLAAGLDALSHALESIWNINANPVSDQHAVAAAREVMISLPKLMKNLRDVGLRERMAFAALTAGLAFSNTRTALAHSISYDMTMHHGLPHGIACSFTLPMVLKRAIGADAGRDAVLARVFDDDLANAPRKLTEFIEQLGVSTRFDSYGVSETEARQMIANALEGVRGKNFVGTAMADRPSEPIKDSS